MSEPYPREFRETLVRRLTEPNPESTMAISQETGVHQTTLSRWVREAGGGRSLKTMAKHKTSNRTNTRTSTRSTGASSPAARRAKDWSLQEKLRVLMDTASLSDEELGAYLRLKGLHEAQLVQWRLAVEEALQRSVPKPKVSPEQKAQKRHIHQLERELNRKDKALAEAAALLVLKKKVQAIWGDEDGSITERND